MFRPVLTAAVLCATIAQAQSFDSMQRAHELGGILGSETACGLAYSHAAVEAWIDANVDPADMSFPSTLSMMTQGAELEARSMNGAALAAHCRAVERTARHFNFID